LATVSLQPTGCLGKVWSIKKLSLRVGEFSNPFLGGGTFTRPGFPLVKIFVNQPKLLLLSRWNAMRFFPNQRRLLLMVVLDLLLVGLKRECELGLVFLLLF
jgi:hypothetical protein